MRSVGGNTAMNVRRKVSTGISPNGVGMPESEEWGEIHGWLDLLTGTSSTAQNAKLAQASHVFICDVPKEPLPDPSECVLVEGAQAYRVEYIDPVQGRGSHLEVYLSELEGDTYGG